MRRRAPPSPYRAPAPGATGHVPDSISVIRSFNVETNPTRPVRPSPLTVSNLPDMPLDMLDRMRSFPLFMSAPEEFLVALGKHLRPQVHAINDHIVTEGDDAKAMYWLVRGAVAVTSRDGEAIYAELKPGSFFGEIGVLMDMPRTATIVARTKCLLLVLKKEQLQNELPVFPEMEKAIRHEAHERLTILNKKRQENGQSLKPAKSLSSMRESTPGEVFTGDSGIIAEGVVVNHKKRKSPSPGIIEDPAAGSALGSGFVNVRQTLRELPLFSTLPPDILHFLGMSAQPKTYPPFTDIIRQGATGNDIYFIVRGEAEVIHENEKEVLNTNTKLDKNDNKDDNENQGLPIPSPLIRPRLKPGQFFGEVASLGLSRGRTATVRSISTVECLMISGEALEALWQKCPPEIKNQVEQTARTRIRPSGDDIEMSDSDGAAITITAPTKSSRIITSDDMNRKPGDPDPFLSVDMENIRNRRRGSLAPPTPTAESPTTPTSAVRLRIFDPITPSRLSVTAFSSEDCEGPSKRAKILPSRPAPVVKSSLPDDVAVSILQWLDIAELMRLRLVSAHWRDILSSSPKLCGEVDLTPYNRTVTDHVLTSIIAPFVGPRASTVDISNCFHVTDEGFSALWKTCGKNVKVWRMRSVWEVSANQILEMSEHAKGLEYVDWSNCRKVGDNLLARVVGWIVPETSPQTAKQIAAANARAKAHKGQQQAVILPPPGTVIGCSKLKRLNLSYCKHITDRSMAHMAAHASNRIESLTLTRCTSITDAGFQSWTPFRFNRLTKLCLADCTYLSDNAIVALVNAAKSLTHLDLSFCCALSDTATEVVALGLPQLVELKMAFCGSAVSDNSLACIALHLNDLERLSVRGCVRVTAVGAESVLDGCTRLNWFDVSQCRNIESWVNSGGVSRWGYDERGPASVIAERRAGAIQTRNAKHWRPRQSVAFVVEKGPGGLR